MPGGDGLVILERFKSNRLLSHIPVIVVTVRDRQDAEEKTQRLGAAAYLQKPIHDNALMETLRTVLATACWPGQGQVPMEMLHFATSLDLYLHLSHHDPVALGA